MGFETARDRAKASGALRNLLRLWQCRALPVILALPAVMGVAGCMGLTSQASQNLGQVSATPNSVAFGDVEVGTSSTQTVTINNTGTSNLTFSQAAVSGAGFTVTGPTFPLTLSAGQSSSFILQFAPTVTGTATGTVSLDSNASNSPTSVALKGNGVKHQLSITPSSVSFGNVTVGAANTQSITLTNSGTANLNITQGSITGTGFGMSGLVFPFSLVPGQSSTLNAQFAPTAPGSAVGNISISSNAHNSPTVASLAGNGTQPALSLSPTSVSFGNVAVGGNATGSLTLTDTGNAALVLTAANISGVGYSLTGLSLPWTLGPGQSGTLTVQFSPSTCGTASGSLSLLSNAPGSPLLVPLSGSGVSQSSVLSVSPTSLDFGTVLTGGISTQNLTLSNTGTSSYTISQIAASGSGFSASGLSLPATLAGGQTASLSVTFAPTVAGSVTGAVTITSTASNTPVTVTLAGNATTPQPQITISPTSINFGNINVGQSNTQSITVSNPGNAVLNITQATASGTAFGLSGQTLPLAINPGQSAVWTASFSPTSVASYSGSISIASNAAGSPATIALSGAGVQGTLTASPSSFNFGNILVGSSGTQTLTLSNSGTASVTISAASASGTGFSITGLTVPLTLAAGQNTTFTAQFAPSATGSANGSASVTSNASGSLLTIALSGTGVQPQLSVTPTSVSFGSLPVGSTNSQNIMLNNAGTASLTISQATVSGPGFGLSGLNVPLTIVAGANATFTATYAPSSESSATGSISLTSNAPGSPLNIPLAGTGVTATYLLNAAPSSLSFGSVIVGGNSTLNVILTNSGNSSLTISGVTVSDSSYTTSGVAAGMTLAPGQSTTLAVRFSPTTATTLSGNVTVTSNATNSPLVIAVSGTGVQQHSVDLSWAASTSSVVGYFIYRGSVSGGPYTKLNSTPNTTTSYTDTTVVSGQTYYYVVTAIDSSNVESSHSNEVSASVP